MALAALVAADTDHGSERAEKQPGAFRTISEVADDLGIPQHVLRFWEGRFGQIRPLKRAGGRRYYRPDDVDLIKGIQHLLHGRGYTIKGAQRVLKENGVRFVQAVGRGEAEAMVPAQQDLDMESGSAPDSDAVLIDVLGELRACRDALSALRPGTIDAA